MEPNELPEGTSQGASRADSSVATVVEAPGADQQSVWLGLGPELFHPPVVRSRSKQVIGISALVVAVAGLAGATGMYFLAGGSPDWSGSQQITAPPTTAPRAQVVLPSVPPSAAPVTSAAPVATATTPVSTPEAPTSPAAPVTTPAAPQPTELAPSPPSRRSSAGGTSEVRRTAVVPAPQTADRSGGDDLRQGATSQDQPPPTSADYPPAPEGWTRVPHKPWNPKGP